METVRLKSQFIVRGLGKKRVRIWLFSLLTIIGILIIRCIFPEWAKPITGLAQLAPFSILLLFSLALVCEYIDSSLGMGYGTTLTPLLLLLGFAPLQIVPCVLLSELLTGFTATLLHHKDGNVNLITDKSARTTALLLCSLSALGAVSAVVFAVSISKVILSLSISLIILAAGILTILTANRQLKYRKGNIVALGAVAAFNKGLSGGGYGPLVTAGQVVSGLSPKKAVALTSLAESVTCFFGLAFYMASGKSIFWPLALPLTFGALFSVPVSTLTVKHLSEKWLKKCVGIVTVILGLFALAKLFLF